MAETIQHHPLMFTFRDVISGDGFLAGVTLSGRALMEFEEGRWCIYGVRPGAIAESGVTPQEAFMRFRNRYKEVLFDIAEECRKFEAFKGEVERFYAQPDQDEERRWDNALTAIRSGKMSPEAPFSDLPRKAAESWPTGISVEKMEAVSRIQPSDNVRDLYAAAA